MSKVSCGGCGTSKPLHQEIRCQTASDVKYSDFTVMGCPWVRQSAIECCSTDDFANKYPCWVSAHAEHTGFVFRFSIAVSDVSPGKTLMRFIDWE